MDKRTIAAVDVGHATTQAALFETVGLSLRLLGLVRIPTPRGPHADLGAAVRCALDELQDQTRAPLLDQAANPLSAATGHSGAPDEWYLTADAAGPVRVTVAGVIDDISGQSALKAALSSGAAVADLLAINDGRPDHHKARDLRQNPVDLILLAGGVDEGLFAGGGGRQVVNIAKTIAMAGPHPRYDPVGRTTVVFAGSTEARPDVADQLDGTTDVLFADNVRPDLSLENLAGARQAIVELFHSRVIPADGRWKGVDRYAGPAGIIPTGLACGHAAELLAAAWKVNVIVADIAESTLNLYSVIDNEPNRTVIDECGLNYDCPASLSALADAALLWLPVDIGREEAGNVLATQRLRPAAVPQTWKELLVQQAAGRERLRVALDGHRKVAALLKGIHRQRNIDEVLGTYISVGGQTIVDLSRVSVIMATGRQVAAATTPGQAMSLIVDGLQPQGITQVLADERGLLPHLGALARTDESLAAQILSESWYERLGVVVAPVPRERGGSLFRRQGARIASVRIEREDGTQIRETVDYGALKRIPLREDEVVRVTVSPDRGHDAGAGYGVTARLAGGGRLGVILDGRGRPVSLPQNPARRQSRIAAWLRTMEAYPESVLANAGAGEAN